MISFSPVILGLGSAGDHRLHVLITNHFHYGSEWILNEWTVGLPELSQKVTKCLEIFPAEQASVST